MKYFKVSLLLIIALSVISHLPAIARKTENDQNVKTVLNDTFSDCSTLPELKLEYVRKMGGEDTYNDNLIFHHPKDITVDRQGNIYILDTDNFRIQKLSPDGDFLLRMGKKGRKKGQLHYPVAIDIDPENKLTVYDMGTNRFDLYDTAGKYERSYHIKIIPDVFKYNSDGYLLIPGNSYSGDPTVKIMKEAILDDNENKADLSLLKIVDPGSGSVRNIGRIPDYGTLTANLMLNRIFFAQDKTGNYVAGFHALNRIEKYDPSGRLILKIERPLNFAVKRPVYDSKNHILSMSRVMEGLGIDSENRIWSVTYNRKLKSKEDISISISVNREGLTTKFQTEVDDDYLKTDAFILEVFSEEGELLKRFPIDHFADDMKIFGDRLFIIDRYREMVIHEYRIISSGELK